MNDSNFKEEPKHVECRGHGARFRIHNNFCQKADSHTLPAGKELKVIGPTSCWRDLGIGKPSINPSNHETYPPSILSPEEGELVGIPKIRLRRNSEESGDLELVLQNRKKTTGGSWEWTFVRFFLGNRTELDLQQFEGGIPDGDATIWSGFKPNSGSSVYYSAPVSFKINKLHFEAFSPPNKMGVKIETKCIFLDTGEKVEIAGPTNKFYAICDDKLEPWRKGNRPWVSLPYESTPVGKTPDLAACLENPEAGRFFFVLQISNEQEYTFYRISPSRGNQVSLKQLGIELPEGDGIAWAGFSPERKDEIRYSNPRCFKVNENRKSKFVFNGLLVQNSNLYEKMKSEFYRNVEVLTYEENLVLRKEEIRKCSAVLTSIPKRISLLLGRRCNSRCIMCPEWRKQDLSTIPAAATKDMAKLLPFIDSLLLTGGEPTLFPEVRKILQDANDFPHIHVEIATNGSTLLHSDWLDIVLRGKKHLILSMDAATKETYEKIRRGLDWDKLMRAMAYIRDNRRGKYPVILIKMVIMRSNFHEIVKFLDLGYEYGAEEVYYNLLSPAHLEPENRFQNIHGDEDVAREILSYMREGKKRANQLGIKFTDKVYGYLLPRYHHMVMNEDELSILPAKDREIVREQIPRNREEEEKYWKSKGGRPEFPGLPTRTTISYSHDQYSSSQFQTSIPMGDVLPNYFFCSHPFLNLNMDPEITFTCCDAIWPLNHISYGSLGGVFDIWNHPLLQFVRRSMFEGTAPEKVCPPVCPYYREGGSKSF